MGENMEKSHQIKRHVQIVLMQGFVWLSASLTVLLVVSLIGYIAAKGFPHVSWDFISGVPSILKKTMGILPNILNTFYIVLFSLVFALPLGVGAAVYLTEYAAGKRLVQIVEFAVETLAGIPSVVYGLAGMLIFSQLFGFKTSLLSGGCTMVIMILPTIIRTTQEALRTVPTSCREGALGLGAPKWYMIRTVVLPSCQSGILTGCILSVGRIVGESAALLFTAGVGTIIADNMLQAFSKSGGTLSVALYMYVSEKGDFETGFAIAAVLMVLVLLMNGLAKMTTKLSKKMNA